jgi:hypothetical protein
MSLNSSKIRLSLSMLKIALCVKIVSRSASQRLLIQATYKIMEVKDENGWSSQHEEVDGKRFYCPGDLRKSIPWLIFLSNTPKS